MNLHALSPERVLLSPLPDGVHLEPSEGEMAFAVDWGTVDFFQITDARGRVLHTGGPLAPHERPRDSTFQIVWDARGIWSIS